MSSSTDLTASLAIVRHELDQLDELLREERQVGADLGTVLHARKQDVDVASVKIGESWDQIGGLESYKIDLEQVVKCMRKECEDAQALEGKIQGEVRQLHDRIEKYVAKFEADCNVFGVDVSQTVIKGRVGEKKERKNNIEMEVAKMKDSKEQYQDAVAAYEAEIEDKELQIRSVEQENTKIRKELESAAHLQKHLSSQLAGALSKKSAAVAIQKTVVEMSMQKDILQNEISVQLHKIYCLEQELQQQLKLELKAKEAKLSVLELSVKALSGGPPHSSHFTSIPSKFPQQFPPGRNQRQDCRQSQYQPQTLEEVYIAEELNQSAEEANLYGQGYSRLDNSRKAQVGCGTYWVEQQTPSSSTAASCADKPIPRAVRNIPDERATKRRKPLTQIYGSRKSTREKKGRPNKSKLDKRKDVESIEVDIYGGRRHTIFR